MSFQKFSGGVRPLWIGSDAIFSKWTRSFSRAGVAIDTLELWASALSAKVNGLGLQMASRDEKAGSQPWSSACIPFIKVLEFFPGHPKNLV